MSTTPDYELLRDSHAIIDGIPDKAVSFGVPCALRGPALDDGTVCSPEGWLALHPTFNALGLTMTPDGTSLAFHGEAMSAVAAMARAFRLTEEEAARLFGERSIFLGTQATDKELWLSRVRHHIHNTAFSDTIATMAAAPAVTLDKITDAIEGEPK